MATLWIPRWTGLGGAVAALMMLGLGGRGIRLAAAEAPLECRAAGLPSQRQSSSAGETSPEWTATDFAAMALMALGAATVFVPVPRSLSRKPKAHGSVSGGSAKTGGGSPSVDSLENLLVRSPRVASAPGDAGPHPQ